MRYVREIAAQTLGNLRAHKLRSILTMFGIAWGIASVVLMIAIGDGFKIGYRDQLRVLGTDIVIIWGGRTAAQAGDQRAGRNIWLTSDDAQAIKEECYLVRHVTPELSRQIEAKSPYNAGVFSVTGVMPVYQEIRSMKLSGGRLINDTDESEGRRVCVIGSDVRKQLFADRQAIGAEIRIRDVPFTIIGTLEEKKQNNAYNGLDGNKILVPYAVMAKQFPDPRPFLPPRYVNNIIIVPAAAEQHDGAVKQVKSVLGRFHGFDPRDEGALWIWDTIETVKLVSRIFESMQMFLGFVAVVTLSLGGIGVMNIMLVSVAERTREIGLKKALGATRRRILLDFFLESLGVTMVSGVIGLACAWGASAAVGSLPLPPYVGGLPITRLTALIAFGTLVAVGIFSGVYPAQRASRLSPVEALRYE
jgi:putative ABC transport system permease protein